MIHLHWNWIKSENLEERGIALALATCGKRFARSSVSVRLDSVTCPECRARAGTCLTDIEKRTVMTTDVQSMSGPQLVQAYNELRAANGKSKIKKFRDLETGRRLLTQAREAARAVPPAAPQAETSAMNARFVRPPKNKRGGFSLDATIEILDADGKVKTKGETKKRWDKLMSSEKKTVRHYCDNIGKPGDLKWWSDQEKIKIK